MAEDFPQELDDACKNFEASMLQVEKTVVPLLETERSQLIRGMNSLDAAKLDLLGIYAMNSFYWAYLIMQGIDPKNHPIKQELNRIQTYMARVEEIKNRKNAPKLNKQAAKRFVRNAMFDSEQKNAQNNDTSQQNNLEAKSEQQNEQNHDKVKIKTKDELKKKKMKRKSNDKDKKSKKRHKHSK